MQTAVKRAVQEVRVGEDGEIKMPPRYRRAHRLSKGSRMFVMQVGDALMLLPEDQALEKLSRRIRDALESQGVTVERALKNLPKVRRRLFDTLYGKR